LLIIEMMQYTLIMKRKINNNHIFTK